MPGCAGLHPGLRRLSLTEALGALASAAAPSGEAHADPGASGPKLCPRFITTYSPRVDWPRPGGVPAGDWQGHNRWQRLQWVPEPPGSPGFISPAKSVQRGRYGLSGLTSNGRREIWRSLKLLEEYRAQMFFWTITLPDAALAGIEAGRGWAGFQDRVRHELVRLLVERLGVAMVVGVAEVQPKRLRNRGTFAPHLHVAFVGKRKGWYRWAFDHSDLDRIIERAAVAAGSPPFRASAAGQVEPVRASVAAYMAKYMTKGSQDVTSALTRLDLVPRQWWFRSQAVCDWVRRSIFPLALGFVAWVHEQRRGLEDRGLIRHQQVQGLPESAPICWRVDWRGPPQLAEVLALYQEWLWEADWVRRTFPIHGRPDARQHPFFDQQLRTAPHVGRAVLPEPRKRGGDQCSPWD